MESIILLIALTVVCLTTAPLIPLTLGFLGFQYWNTHRKLKTIQEREIELSKMLSNLSVERLIEEPDLLSELMKYHYLLTSANTTRSAPQSPVPLFLDEIRSRMKLENLNWFGERVQFDPGLHRSLDRVPKGSEVEVLECGWRLNGKILKYPIVQPVNKEGK